MINVTVYKNASDCNDKINGQKVQGKNVDEVYETMNSNIVPKIDNFYAWSTPVKDGATIYAMTGVWD